MSMAMIDVIPIMDPIDEIKDKCFQVICTQPYAYCKVVEDNSGALELARLPKLCPRRKHINVYHQLYEHVHKGLIKSFHIDTKYQMADALPKALAQHDFTRHCKYMCGK